MAKARRKALLRLRVDGPGIRPGAINVPDLMKILEHAQSAINRQAEAMEGERSLRPGPVISAVKKECTLELVGIGRGSTTLQFDLAKAQIPLPNTVQFGIEVVANVAGILASLMRKPKAETPDIDAGVLVSLDSMGEVFDRGSVSKIEWVVPKRNGLRRGIKAVFTKAVRQRVAERIQVPSQKHETVEGILEMADFKESDQKCRVHPVLGYPVVCTFDKSKEEAVYSALRKTVRLSGQATINPNSGRVEGIRIEQVEPIGPLTVGAKVFFSGQSIQELAKSQGVRPLETIRVLAGGWPDQDNFDDVLEEIYRDREL